MDGDGREDLIIGTGVGGHLAVYRNRAEGGFHRLEAPPLDQPVARDLTTILGWTKTNGQRILLAGSSNYEDAARQGSCVREFDLNNQRAEDKLPASESSTGPLAMADWDDDGILDLFVGGRVLPGRYPEEPFSLLFRGTGTGFNLDRESTKQIARAGSVSGAVFSDLDADGRPELVLACEWGPVRIFRYDRSHWRELTRELGFEGYVGWWNAVAAGDFDGDGRMDIVASNWGRNTKYQIHRRQPVRIVYGDWKNNGTVDTLEAYYDESMKKWVPWCSFAVAQSMPWVIEQFPIKVYGEQRGCAVCDYDGDGRVDLVVTQNGAQTRLYHNDGAKPGLRVRLIGPPGNPNGIGATLRVVMDGRSGPAREIHVGSGYWSEDSVVQVMATPEPPTQLDVRWPGGKTVRSNLPKNACEIAVDSSGQVKVVR